MMGDMNSWLPAQLSWGRYSTVPHIPYTVHSDDTYTVPNSRFKTWYGNTVKTGMKAGGRDWRDDFRTRSGVSAGRSFLNPVSPIYTGIIGNMFQKAVVVRLIDRFFNLRKPSKQAWLQLVPWTQQQIQSDLVVFEAAINFLAFLFHWNWSQLEFRKKLLGTIVKTFKLLIESKSWPYKAHCRHGFPSHSLFPDCLRRCTVDHRRYQDKPIFQTT